VIERPFGPSPTAVAVDDPSDIRQTDAGAFELVVSVEALKDAEEFVDVLHIEANSIVSNIQRDLSGGQLQCPDLDVRLGSRRRELDGIGDKVRKYLP